MASDFDLIVTADYVNRTAEFRLLDAHGLLLCAHHTDFKIFAIGRLQGLFDLREYLRLYVRPANEAAAIDEISVCIANEVLGRDIFNRLWQSKTQKSLRIQLPGAADENHLAAALARIPWEMARAEVGQPSLAECNIKVRVIQKMETPEAVPQPTAPAAGECLRILFVFAESPNSHPLAVRQERRELQRLCEEEIFPKRQVVAHFLSHGVTRERLEAQIRENKGYHIVHWSGHGQMNGLELARPNGTKHTISGLALLKILKLPDCAPPRLVFLSACHSGDLLNEPIWKGFIPEFQSAAPSIEPPKLSTLDWGNKGNYSGSAHALLKGGVPTVVAMRYAVGDDYSRVLAVEFYRRLFSSGYEINAAAALTLARGAILNEQNKRSVRFAACDHAAPVLYGTEEPGLIVVEGCPPESIPRGCWLHLIEELRSTTHEHFVGRTWELAKLGAEFIGSAKGTEVRPVATVIGLGGMGKTALTAEILDLWDTRFQWVLLYQAKPRALDFEEVLRDIHLKLMREVGIYHDHVKKFPADAIHDGDVAQYANPERLLHLTHNLIGAMKQEPILLVLDNFDANLKDDPECVEVPALPSWTCDDPAWERCLTLLAENLRGSPSRVFISSRKPLSALEGGNSCSVMLGPLPSLEANLFLRSHPALSQMAFGSDSQERALALRLLGASRFHPLLMDRLARLSGDPGLRGHLTQCLEILEKTEDFARLPSLLANDIYDAAELSYIENALVISLDQFLRGLSPEARRVLWFIGSANEPVSLRMLSGVWEGEARTNFHSLTIPLASLLTQLVRRGLVTELGKNTPNTRLSCHELIRERICVWMEQHSSDRQGLAREDIWRGFASHLGEEFTMLQQKNSAAAQLSGSSAIVYLVQCGDWDELCGMAAEVINGSIHPDLLDGLIPHLKKASELAPEGRPRWICLCNLADAVRHCGQVEASLSVYGKAALMARAAAESGGDEASRAWRNLSAICSNWAVALNLTGNHEEARQRQVEAAEASAKTAAFGIDSFMHEMEELRMDLMQGRVEKSLPKVKERVKTIRGWWEQHCKGLPVTAAPNPELLGRAYISTLDIAHRVYRETRDWKSALSVVNSISEVKNLLGCSPDDIGLTRKKRADLLMSLQRYAEAKSELEACLEIFRHNPVREASTLSSLAEVFRALGDAGQATAIDRRALAVHEQFSDSEALSRAHYLLAMSLKRSGDPSAQAEAMRYELAGLLFLIAGPGKHLDSWRNDFVPLFLSDQSDSLPPVRELLADPAFSKLATWLQSRHATCGNLQAAVDGLVKDGHQIAPVVEALGYLEAAVLAELWEPAEKFASRVDYSLTNYLLLTQGDAHMALPLARRALRACENEKWDAAATRARSHHSLANCLGYISNTSLEPEIHRHWLAGFAYLLIDLPHQTSLASLTDYAGVLHRTAAASIGITIPILTEILGDPEFEILKIWLGTRGTNIEELQHTLEQMMETIHPRTIH
ncbi:MAG: CHAT domain-containing protein [Verrucomicrobiota bacterium]